MSGHSKWASIKHKKGAADAKRGKIFTRHAKLIEISAREGGSGDPSMNPSLKAAIDNAKAENVPNMNIDRAVKKGSGELKGNLTVAVIYEAYGPGGAAVIVECLTDNKNRTLSSVKSTIEKRGGKWAESGSVMWMFEKKGIVIAKADGELSDEVQLELIDAGAEDFEASDGTVTVTTGAVDWPKVRDAIKSAGMELEEAGMKYVAKQSAEISDVESAKKLMNFVEELEADEDVSEVHTNADITEEIANQL
ncbi:MAG: YebC/PmpR family DNA-binding transcriptional regulator [Candidatus Peribacteraceae bacterium]|jgi:YebC/PmpR family DNA-binding regulatory protein|nr:YebC/PmpR family DNA-binding transcriptional regulator [Candidatus Peribacteraceae bacterium]MDP7454271.1 YebC/PmpR family DNA-binding transcriptional regulator [Candidatus Peribacteraceae bacterium]MDP7645761.1 YebC/PmpR family DNA-binding transcriptional regulator [Candidatus Peribacteraceae bacterium]|tara:strand:+ start:783 stop:1532 length:750 start_codon:yes stop_codon:yes gene_type:complete